MVVVADVLDTNVVGPAIFGPTENSGEEEEASNTTTKRKIREDIRAGTVENISDNSGDNFKENSDKNCNNFGNNFNKNNNSNYVQRNIFNRLAARAFLCNYVDIINSEDVHIGGKLSEYYSEWKNITDNWWVLDSIKNGVKLQFDETPIMDSMPTEYYGNSANEKIIDNEINELLKKGAIELVTDTENDSDNTFYSRIFVVPKKEKGKWRAVLDLRELNKFVTKKHFKMEGLQEVREALHKGDYMTRIDLTDAYYHVKIDNKYKDYLRFKWRGKTYRYTGLVMGITSAPRIFTKIMKEAIRLARKLGIRCIFYIDDILIIAHNAQEGYIHTKIVLQILGKLGFTVNFSKSELVPKQKIEFLGFVINSVEMTIEVANNKLKVVLKMLKQLLKNRTCTIRNLAKIIGKLVALSPAIFPAKLYCRSLMQDRKNAYLTTGDWDGVVTIGDNSVTELHWWLNSVKDWNGISVINEQPNSKAHTDASAIGWAFVLNNKYVIFGLWRLYQKSFSNNAKEMYAIYLGICRLAKLLRGQVVSIFTDNFVTLCYINHQGGSSSFLTHIARKIWNVCFNYNIKLQVEFIPGKQNTLADLWSRFRAERYDFELMQADFERIVEKWGQPEVDLFASEKSRKTTKYFSWTPERQNLATDALSQFWGNINGYAFPPVKLIGRVLQKVHLEKATITIVTPHWEGASWWPILKGMAIDKPIKVTINKQTIHQNAPIFVETEMLAWRVSGKRWKGRAWTRQPSNKYKTRGLKARVVNIPSSGTGGDRGVSTRGWTH